MNDRIDSDKEQRLFSILREDIRRVDFRRTFGRELAELREVMLTEQRRDRLESMRQPRRTFVMAWWLLRSLIRKLTPARRLLLVAALIFMLIGRIQIDESSVGSFHFDATGLGIIVLLLILGLELKDKLLAHEELQAGRAVQNALMPERSPAVPGWQLWLFTRSANEVGGDLLDFIRFDGTRYGIVLGDVAGKGLSAALFSAKLQATLRAIVPDARSLQSLGRKLNQIFCSSGLRSVFASLNYLEIRPDSGQVRVLNAGHFPPIIVRGRGVESLMKGGPALGVVPDGEFTEQSVDLGMNDSLLVYSDGLTEAQSVAGEFYGEERFLSFLPGIATVPAFRFGERLVAEVDRFIGDGRASDDLSIVILKRSEVPAQASAPGS